MSGCPTNARRSLWLIKTLKRPTLAPLTAMVLTRAAHAAQAQQQAQDGTTGPAYPGGADLGAAGGERPLAVTGQVDG